MRRYARWFHEGHAGRNSESSQPQWRIRMNALMEVRLMLRFSAVVVAMLLVASFALAQDAGDVQAEPVVNLEAQSQPVQSVAAEITTQTGVQVAVTANTRSNLTGKLEDKTLDEAVKLLAEGSQASWMRAYLLELAPPEEPYTAEEILVKLSEAREEFLASLTDEQRQALFGRMPGREDGRRGGPEREGANAGEGAEAGEAAAGAGEGPGRPERPEGERPERPERPEGEPGERGQRGGPGGGFGQMLAGPGGGVAVIQAREGDPEGARGGWAMMAQYDDPVRRLLLPGRTEEITMDVADVTVFEAIDAFILDSRFIVAVDPQIDPDLTLSVSVDEAELSEVLDAVAEAVGGQWRSVYVLGQPRELTQAEVAQREEQREIRRDERFNTRWAEFWNSAPQERAESIQRRVEGVERMAQRIQDAPPERRERMVRRQGRMFDRMVGYSTQLSPEQRLEIKPLLQAMARARAN